MSANSRPAELDARLFKLSAAILLEKEIRQQRTRADLESCLVNDTVRVHGQDLAVLLTPRFGRLRVSRASSIPLPDKHSPFARWLERVVFRLKVRNAKQSVSIVGAEDVCKFPDSEFAGWVPRSWILMPLVHPGGDILGLLILMRSAPWTQSDLVLAEPMRDCYGHALASVGLRRRKARWPLYAAMAGLMAAGAGWGASKVSVPLTTIAPAEVAAANPIPITSPIDGVVREVLVRPYQSVRTGDVLLTFDDEELRTQVSVAERSLAVAMAELASIRNLSFLDPLNRSKLSAQEQKVALQEDIARSAVAKLARLRVVADQDGLVLFDDRFGWQGRPVSTGQRLMTLAQHDQVELHIDVPPDALIPIDVGAPVRLFLDMDPTRSVQARIVSVGYQALPTAAGRLAYRYLAHLELDSGPIQLGARGVARIEGEQVSLIYWIFGRPMSAVRQLLGM